MYLTLSFLSLIETISPQDTWSPYRVSFNLIKDLIEMKYIEWITDGREDKFYNSRPWRNLRLKALERDHHECQMCKKNSKVNKIVFANTVHHIKEVKDRPDLAMDLDNLISLCRKCHEEIHERLDKANEKRKKVSKFMNEERW